MNALPALLVCFLTHRLEVDDDMDEDEDEDDDLGEDDEEDEDDFDDDDEEPETWQVTARQRSGRSTPNVVPARANPLRDV
jgi:hypothetical protein